jgi:hypothetical protein
VRTRIALAASVAVIVVPAVLFALFSTSAPAAARTSHLSGSQAQVGGRHPATRIDMKLMSYSQSERAAKVAAYDEVVNAHKEAAYLKAVAYLKEVAYLNAVAAANSVNAIPAAWLPTAICEEDGRDDPYAGYFGILEWNGFDGYQSAGSAPVSVQLAWEAAHGQGPPDAPGQCHGY